jgi:hypothetical protein
MSVIYEGKKHSTWGQFLIAAKTSATKAASIDSGVKIVQDRERKNGTVSGIMTFKYKDHTFALSCGDYGNIDIECNGDPEHEFSGYESQRSSFKDIFNHLREQVNDGESK